MKVFDCKKYVGVFGLLLLMGSTAHAVTLSVNCGGAKGLNSINAALKVLQRFEFGGPAGRL